MSAQEDYDGLAAFAARLFKNKDGETDTDGANKFIGDAMARLGHKAQTSWLDAEPEGRSSKKSAGFFDQY